MVYNRGNDKINICLDQESGTYSLELQGGALKDMCAAVRLEDGRLLKTTDLWKHEISETQSDEAVSYTHL